MIHNCVDSVVNTAKKNPQSHISLFCLGFKTLKCSPLKNAGLYMESLFHALQNLAWREQ